jgi:hypothetical protein
VTLVLTTEEVWIKNRKYEINYHGDYPDETPKNAGIYLGFATLNFAKNLTWAMAMGAIFGGCLCLILKHARAL